MNLKINFNLDTNLPENEIIIDIKSAHHSDDLQKILSVLQQLNNKKDSVVGFIENKLYITPTDDIIYFYTKEQKCYYKVEDKNYYIKKRLYELEEILNHEQFIRISNSCIINIRKIKCFDLNHTGNIRVKFINGDSEDVSKRRVPLITKFLKERWG